LILRQNLLRNPNVGLFSLATNAFAIFPANVPRHKLTKFKECLSVEAIRINVSHSTLNGALVVANSKGIALPHIASGEDIEVLKRQLEDIEVQVVNCKQTSLGNLVLANDRGALVCSDLSLQAIEIIESVLDVEVEHGTIADLPIVGSLAVATNKGAIADPSLKEHEKELLEDLLKVEVRTGTVNDGVPFVKSGLVANDRGAIVGDLTTGFEVAVISEALHV
jgi:translation initiation factor 6